MAHTFEGVPDARQAGDIRPSRFRPQYRALSDAEKALHDAIKAKAAELEALFEKAREMRIAPRIAAINADIPAFEPDQEHDGQTVISGTLRLRPPLDLARLEQLHPLGYAPSHFDEGMKALELAVMWTVKGLTA